MAAAELRVELKLRDGQQRTVSVPVQENLSSLICGLSELNRTASRLLSELVEQEKNPGGGAQGGEEEDGDEEEDGGEEEDIDEEEESNGVLNSEVQPPPKRSRT